MSKKELNRIPINQMERGDILLMAPRQRIWKHWISNLISWGSNTQWTHAAIYLGNGLIIEATHKGIHIETIETGHYEQDYDWLTLRLKPRSRFAIPEAIKFAKSKMWRGYDYIQAIWLGAIYLISRFFKFSADKLLKRDNKWDDKTRFFCSELVVDSFLHAGLSFAEDLGIDEANILAEDLLKSKHLYLVNKLEE